MKNLHAIILAGREGTELRPITCHIPKALIPIGGFPCIYYVLDQLRYHGVEKVTLSLQYKGDMVAEAVKNLRGLSLQLTEETGFAAACGKGSAEDILMVFGDCIWDFDLTEVLKFHREKGNVVTVILTKVKEPTEFCVALTNEDGVITRFIENPAWSRAYSDTVNTGMYLFSKEILEHIPRDYSCDFVKDIFPKLLAKNIPVNGYTAEGYWCDIGSFTSYKKCNKDLLDGKIKIPRKLSVFEAEPPLKNTKPMGDTVYIGQNTEILRAETGPYSVIGNGCTLKNGAAVKNSILMDNVTLEENVSAQNCIIGEGTIVKAGSSLGENCVIGARTVIGEDTVVCAGTKIYPDNVIPENSFINYNVIHGVNRLRFENGKLHSRLDSDTDISLFLKTGAAFALTVKKSVAVGIDKIQNPKKITPLTLALCGGITSASENAFHLGECDFNVFRYAVKTCGFGGGLFISTDNDGITLTPVESDGLGLGRDKERCFEKILYSEDTVYSPGGEFRYFRGYETLYEKDFVEKLKGKHPLKAILSAPPFITDNSETEQSTEEKEYIYVMPQRLVIQKQTREAYDTDLIKCVTAYCCGMLEGEVFIPYDYPAVIDTVAKKCGFSCKRLTLEDDGREKLYPMSDTYRSALYLLRIMAERNKTFGEIAEEIPLFSSRHREVEVSANKASLMKLLASGRDRELVEGIKIKESGGTVHIVPQKLRNAFNVCAESSDGETAGELCDFYAKKLKK